MSFVGKKYKLDKSENFDEYMKELGKLPKLIRSASKIENQSARESESGSGGREKKPKTRHRKSTGRHFSH